MPKGFIAKVDDASMVALGAGAVLAGVSLGYLGVRAMRNVDGWYGGTILLGVGGVLANFGSKVASGNFERMLKKK